MKSVVLYIWIKKQSLKGEAILANHLSGKRLKSRIYKECLQLHNKTQSKMGKGVEQTFLHRKSTNGQEICEKVRSISSHQWNAIETMKSLYTHEDSKFIPIRIVSTDKDVEKFKFS